MKRLAILCAVIAQPVAAQDSRIPASQEEETRSAVSPDFFYSSDADDTEVLKLGGNFDLRRGGPEEYLGVRVEKAWFNPVGRGWESRNRFFVRGADNVDGWKWSAQVGSDGDNVIGSASIHDEDRFRKEIFVERDILETRQGLDRGIYYTFVGAAVDLPADDRNVVNLLAGVQGFTGDNVRTHLRASYVHVLKPEWGLSAQLRTRYFHNSVPREYDYYSPRWYAQVLPVLQLRRFRQGWMYLVAGGIGTQKDSASGWRRSSYLNARITSPVRNKWAVTGAFLFSETPTVTGQSYDYMQMNFGVTRAF